MKSIHVREVMVPLSEYATVSKEATLYDAVLALEKAQGEFDQTRYRHRAILVYDENKKIVGKVSQLDLLKALEPKYEQIGNPGSMVHYGFNPRFLKSLFRQFDLWSRPLDDICKKASRKKVESFMYTPTEGEYVSEDATLNEAVHQLVIGHHQSLLW